MFFLKATVTNTAIVENRIKDALGVESLSQEITRASQKVSLLRLFSITLPIGMQPIQTERKLLRWLLNSAPVRIIFSSKESDSSVRHSVFYRTLLVLIIIVGVLGTLATSHKGGDKSKAATDTQTLSTLQKEERGAQPESADGKVGLDLILDVSSDTGAKQLPQDVDKKSDTGAKQLPQDVDKKSDVKGEINP